MLRWCQVAEARDWQPQHDADCGSQKVEPGSTSLRQKSSRDASTTVAAVPRGISLKLNAICCVFFFVFVLSRIRCERSLRIPLLHSTLLLQNQGNHLIFWKISQRRKTASLKSECHVVCLNTNPVPEPLYSKSSEPKECFPYAALHPNCFLIFLLSFYFFFNFFLLNSPSTLAPMCAKAEVLSIRAKPLTSPCLRAPRFCSTSLNSSLSFVGCYFHLPGFCRG